MKELDKYLEGLTKSGAELKRLLSEAQIRIGMMETYLYLIQKELMGNSCKEEK